MRACVCMHLCVCACREIGGVVSCLGARGNLDI